MDMHAIIYTNKKLLKFLKNNGLKNNMYSILMESCKTKQLKRSRDPIAEGSHVRTSVTDCYEANAEQKYRKIPFTNVYAENFKNPEMCKRRYIRIKSRWNNNELHFCKYKTIGALMHLNDEDAKGYINTITNRLVLFEYLKKYVYLHEAYEELTSIDPNNLEYLHCIAQLYVLNRFITDRLIVLQEQLHFQKA
jgi:hypothetical protein